MIFGVFTLLLTLSSAVYWQNNAHSNFKTAVQRISQYQDNTYTAFKAQLKRRKQLAVMLQQRLNVKRARQWEMFLSHHYSKMNKEELFVCAQMRAITDHGLYENNLAILKELENSPDIYQHIKLTKELYQHLNFWVEKYQSVFKQRKDMCLLYIGVEDETPYPSGVDENVKKWLDAH